MIVSDKICVPKENINCDGFWGFAFYKKAGPEQSHVTGFGAFYQPTKAGRAVALIGWKANRQAFACVEAVGTDEELNCCLKRLTA